MNFAQFLNDTVFTAIEGIIILLLFTHIVGIKDFVRKNRLKSFIFIVFFAIFSYFSTTYVNPSLNTLFHFLFIILLLSFITNTNLLLSAIGCTMIIVFFIITELFVLSIQMLLFKMDVKAILNNPVLKLQANLLLRFIQFVSVFLLHRIRFPVNKLFNLSSKSSSYSYILLQIFTVGFISFSYNYISSMKDRIIPIEIFLFLIYLFLIILGFFDFMERERLVKLQYAIKVQQDYAKNMETVVNIIRKEKHDFINHLNALYAMSTLEVPDLSKKISIYIENLTDSLSHSYQFYNTGNEYINGFLAVKSNIAFKHNIQLDVGLESPLNEVDVSDSDLVSIIGNILDNAMEALLRQPDQENQVISLFSYKEGNDYILSISNNGPVIPEKDLESIFESRYTTKSDDKGEHGYGLQIVKQLVQKNGGTISITSTQYDGTEFLIRLPVKK